MAEPVRFQHFEVPLREDGSLHELGRGAMGITYKAFDTNLRCFVALKVINAAYLSSEVARQRFLREARAAAALRHPNVATVFHLGEEGGDCFYAMEYIDGETVEAMMKREGAIPVRIALEIVLQVARALGAAQKQGLVHRDIKPSNLMIIREDEEEFTVKVIDFGLAKSAAGSAGEDTATLTMGGFLGTPHFASPEQLEERDLDVRSDIYSLGVTLYYMLAGRAPFSGSLAQVMSQHLHREPPLETLSDQPKPVVDLLRHMLAKDPSARPQTPGDLRREVETCLAALKDDPSSSPSMPPADPENFETQVMDAPAATSTELVGGTVLAERFRLTVEVRASDFGRLFKAASLESPGTDVGILLLDSSFLTSSSAFTRIEDQVVALQKISAPALQKILSLERAENTSFLVLEWIEGPSLLDLMRSRKALPALEALPILRELATGFGALQAAGFPCPDIASHEVTLCEADVSHPVTEWPAVKAKFNPLSPGAPIASPDATLVTSTFALLKDSGAFSENETRAFVYAIGSLAYEMLGGARGSGSPVPIPGLPETANNALRRALDPAASFESITAFLTELEPPSAASPTAGKPPRPAPAATTPPPLPVEKPKKKSPLPAIVIVVVLGMLVLLGGASFLLLSKKPPVAPVPAATPTPAPTASATPLPTATPVPTPTPDPVAETLSKARDIAPKDPAAALALLVDLLKTQPDLPQAKQTVEEFLAATRDRWKSLTPGQIAALGEPLEDAAGMDFVDAQLLLGELLRETDPKDALKWTLAAANNGNTDAMVLSGLMLSNGLGSDKPNLPEAANWFRRAADQGDPHAMFALGECYLLSNGVTRDPVKAMEWLHKAAALDDVQALNKLGDIYAKGPPGIARQDLKKAFEYFSAAKDLGYPAAFGNLGALFMTAPAGMKDEKLAVEIFQQGIEKGDPRSMYFYAVCLEDGLGELSKDKAAAQTWYIKAAEAGVAKAAEWCKTNNIPFTPPVRPAR